MPAKTILMAAAITAFSANIAAAQITIGPTLAPTGPLTCGDFTHNPNGTWSPMHAVTIPGQSAPVTIGPATELRPGPVFPGSELATALNADCG